MQFGWNQLTMDNHWYHPKPPWVHYGGQPHGDKAKPLVGWPKRVKAHGYAPLNLFFNYNDTHSHSQD